MDLKNQYLWGKIRKLQDFLEQFVFIYFGSIYLLLILLLKQKGEKLEVEKHGIF